MSQRYIIPDEQKDFWGSELLNTDKSVEVEAAHAHIKTYTDIHGLRGELEFRLDDTLKRILKTDRNYMLLSLVPTHLSYLRLKPMEGARDNWCPAAKGKKHSYGKEYSVGNSWHGPVWAADCTQCGYHFCDR